jgi:MFS family permease
VVWQCLHVGCRLFISHLWPHLPALLHKMGFHHISLVIFEAGSALCGAAPSSIAFIIGRAIAGLGSAGIFTGGMMIILPLIPLRKRPTYTSFFGMVFGVASVLGPVMGGAFTDKV